MSTQPNVQASSLRTKEGGFWLGIFLLVLLITAGAAETRHASVAIDGVSLGNPKAAVQREFGQSVAKGALDQGSHWFQYRSKAQVETTVTLSAQGICTRVKGTHLFLGGQVALSLGASRGEVLGLLGEPAKDQSRKGREVLEFNSSEDTVLYLVVEDGLLVQMSAAQGDAD